MREILLAGLFLLLSTNILNANYCRWEWVCINGKCVHVPVCDNPTIDVPPPETPEPLGDDQ